jgi:hypothetical protein
VPLARRVAGKSGASAEGRTGNQLNVPCSCTTGAEAGVEITPPCSQHGAADWHGSQAGAQAGAPQGGAIIGAIGAAIGARDEQGERNSMNDGRRQELNPPKQLLQPGAAARLPRTRARHKERDMMGISTARAVGGRPRGRVASPAATPCKPSPRFRAVRRRPGRNFRARVERRLFRHGLAGSGALHSFSRRPWTPPQSAACSVS